MINNKIVFSTKVKQALAEGTPVLALESTIISHGMPYPENLGVARDLEKLAGKQGATAATICLMDGQIKIGLNENELKRLATEKSVKKVSRRDIGMVLVRKQTGATTVAATMLLAHLAGIRVFATGGIGGVHRGGEKTFDISADLLELSSTPVIVVSAGAKAILDLGKTLEYLETVSVPVLGYKTDIFPAFYSRDSGLPISKVKDAEEIVQIYRQNIELGLKQGVLVANPIPKGAEIPAAEMALFLEEALQEAVKKGIKGQRVTPYLLSRMSELTGGKALEANISLVRNNVILGAEIAVALQ
jgi:pseudouridine-5'-phosphate glycosidase